MESFSSKHAWTSQPEEGGSPLHGTLFGHHVSARLLRLPHTILQHLSFFFFLPYPDHRLLYNYPSGHDLRNSLGPLALSGCSESLFHSPSTFLIRRIKGDSQQWLDQLTTSSDTPDQFFGSVRIWILMPIPMSRSRIMMKAHETKATSPVLKIPDREVPMEVNEEL